jgi:uncharacterized protein YutE (UPF0331/DUF86 family)
MGELLLRKLLACRQRIVRIQAALPVSPDEVLADERTEAFIAFNLLLLVQDALDLAAHLVAERGLAVASTQRESFEALAQAGLVTQESAAGMSRMASLRNRIAHSYGDLDVVRMVRETPTGLETVRRFLDELVLKLGV